MDVVHYAAIQVVDFCSHGNAKHCQGLCYLIEWDGEGHRTRGEERKNNSEEVTERPRTAIMGIAGRKWMICVCRSAYVAGPNNSILSTCVWIWPTAAGVRQCDSLKMDPSEQKYSPFVSSLTNKSKKFLFKDFFQYVCRLLNMAVVILEKSV